jgi:hypothetical protein
MSDFGIKVSNLGNDISTATGTALAFSSKYNVQKVAASGNLTVVGTPSTKGTTAVAHNLGYVPAYLSWCRNPYRTGDPGETSLDGNLYSYVDTANIYFVVYWNGTANQDFDFKYYVLVEGGQ